MREQRTAGQAAVEDVSTEPAIDAGEEGKTQFRAEGTIPPVGSAEPAGPAQASASDLAFGEVSGGGGRAAVGAGVGGGGGGGQPLPDDLRTKFEASLGADLSGVRVHVDANADQKTKAAGAKATATGQDIHLAPGEYDPHSANGQELLAHEVAHTVQQKHAAPQTQAKSELPAPSSSAEREADGAASAMVSGEKATVSPVAEQQPHAKDYSRQELLDAYNSALAKQAWADVSLRLNGFSDDDITMLVAKMTGGQHAHVREAAEAAMPGWSQRVTGAIDAADSNAAKIAVLYAAYEKAVVAARASGDWTEVANRLNGLGDWDAQDRLKKLTWFDYEAIRAANPTPRVVAALDKADTARVARAQAAYKQAIASQDWVSAANHLHGFNDEGMAAALDELASNKDTVSYLKRIKEAAPKDARLVATIDRIAKEHGEIVPDPLVVQPICEMPDVSDDTRPLKGLDLSNFAGNVRIAKFATELEAVYNANRATSGRTDKTKTATALIDHFATSFATTADHYVKGISPTMTVSTFARHWMSEMRERADLDSGTKLEDAKLPTGIGKMQLSEADLTRLDKKHGFSDGEVTNKAGEITIQGQRVHPFVNSFMEILASKGTGFSSSTYPNHGGSAEIAPFCLDVFPKIPLDSRGLYQPDQMAEFIEKINAAAGPGNWSGIYNDTSVIRELPKRGLGGKVDTQAKDGTNNFHGALNLHIHLYVRPPEGWAPEAPDPSAAPKVDPAAEPH